MRSLIQIFDDLMAGKDNIQLSGHVIGTVKRAITGIEEVVFDQKNDIQLLLKQAMRDTMNSNTDFALDNLQATQVEQASLSASLNGKDGILVYNSTVKIINNALAFMASEVHPSDEEGEVYRQWRGVYQNLTGGTETAKAASMGRGYTHVGASPPFVSGTQYSDADFADVTLLDNDIITINWKITVG